MKDIDLVEKNQAVFARNVKTIRILWGWSLAKLAKEAGVSIKTVDRIENGYPCKVETEHRLSNALKMHTGRLWEANFVAEGSSRVVRKPEGRWYFTEKADAEVYHERLMKADRISHSARFQMDPDQIQDEHERLRVGRLGHAVGFSQIMNGVVDSGHYQAAVIECFGRQYATPPPAPVTLLMFMLQGRARFEVEGAIYEIEEGDSLALDAQKGYWREPASPIGPHDLPPKWLNTRLGMFPIVVPKSRGGFAKPEK